MPPELSAVLKAIAKTIAAGTAKKNKSHSKDGSVSDTSQNLPLPMGLGACVSEDGFAVVSAGFIFS